MANYKINVICALLKGCLVQPESLLVQKSYKLSVLLKTSRYVPYGLR